MRLTDAFVDLPDDEPFAPKWPEGLPPPGIYEDVPWDEYRAWPAISQSGLKYAREVSPKHLKAMLDGKIESVDSDAKKFGRATHCAILEPERFARDYRIATPCVARIKSGDRAGQSCGNVAKYLVDGEWHCGTHAKGCEEATDYISQADYESIKAIADAIRGHEVAKMMRQRGGCEVSFVVNWDGFPFKGRADRFIPRTADLPPIIIDLKKITRDKGAIEPLQRQIINYGYDVQAYCYSQAIYDLTGDRPSYAWIFVEDSGLHEIAAYQAGEAIIQLGQKKFEFMWPFYKQWVERDEWPGYTNGLVRMDVDADKPLYWECFRWGVEPK